MLLLLLLMMMVMMARMSESDWGCFRGCAISNGLGAPF